MRSSRPKTRQSVAKNLQVLMAHAGWSQRDLAAKAKVSQRQISNILSQATSCSVETADALAAAFGLQGWHLLLPNLPDDLAESPSIARLVEAYIGSDPAGRAYLNSIADRELSSGTQKPKG